MALTTGSRLGVYEITAPIGEGGMGQVYRARDTRLDRNVALKVLSETLCEDEDHIRRFEREAKLLASLNHPNIAAIHHIEESDGIRCLVLEYVEGETSFIEQKELWDVPFLFMLLCMTLGGEWFWRKRKGLA